MAVRLNKYAQRRLREEQVIWLTTTRADGAPLPTPVWFLWHGGACLIFSRPDALKVKNIRRQPSVALNLNSDAFGGNIVVIQGQARIEQHPVAAEVMAAYLEKYRAGIQSIGLTPESLQAEYTTALTITPTRVRADE
jgi:PPOX class probable F420-dependent enzyme